MLNATKRLIRSRSFRITMMVAGALFLILFLAAWIIGGRLVAPANQTVNAPTDLPMVSFEIESQSGSKIAGWSLSNESEGDRPVLILLHPLRGNRTTMLSRARLLSENGFAIVMIDLQAHGESLGDNIMLGHLEKHDVEAAVTYTKNKFPDAQIGVVGWSLGGASALLATPLDVDAMVLESVYPTVSEAIYDRVDMRIGPLKHLAAPILLGQLPIRLGISSEDLRPIDFIAEVGCPVMILAGDRDLHTPIDESRKMFETASEPKELVIFTGAAHVDLLEFDADRYRTNVVKFLKRHLQKAP